MRYRANNADADAKANTNGIRTKNNMSPSPFGGGT